MAQKHSLETSNKRRIRICTKPELDFLALIRQHGYLVEVPVALQSNKLHSDLHGGIKFQYSVESYVCDFVDLHSKTVINIDGDYWHANPIKYDPALLTEAQQHNVQQDEIKRNYFQRLGYSVIHIWQSDINNHPMQVVGRIKQLLVPSTIVVADWSHQLERLLAYKRDLVTTFESIGVEQIALYAAKHITWKQVARHAKIYPREQETYDALANWATKHGVVLLDKHIHVYKSGMRYGPGMRKVKPKPPKMQRVWATKIVWPENLATLIWEMSMVQLGKKLGVSDKAIKKHCAKFGIATPIVGYWHRRERGYTHEQSLVSQSKRPTN